jgi:hypothetical protein
LNVRAPASTASHADRDTVERQDAQLTGGIHSEDIMPPRSTAAKARIIGRAKPVSEIASEIGDKLQAVSESFLTLAGIAAYIAASEHTATAGEQRQLAAVMFHTARQRFGGVKYDGALIDQSTINELDEMWCQFFKIDRKKLRGGR